MNRIALLAAVLVAPAWAAPAVEDLPALTAQLNKNPSDDALRAKIIKLAGTLKPAPAIPKEARRPFVMAATFQKEAKSPADYDNAIKSYNEALSAAPWWGDAYYNLSVTLESAKKFDAAKKALKFYLLGNPKDASQAEDRLYALEARESLATQEKSKFLIVPGAGVGQVKIGMKESEVSAILGASGEHHDFTGAKGYYEAYDSWGTKPEELYMSFPYNGASEVVSTSQSAHRTAEGVGPGSSLAEVRSAMGAPDAERDYGQEGRALCYGRGIKFIANPVGKVSAVAVVSPALWKKYCQ